MAIEVELDPQMLFSLRVLRERYYPYPEASLRDMLEDYDDQIQEEGYEESLNKLIKAVLGEIPARTVIDYLVDMGDV